MCFGLTAVANPTHHFEQYCHADGTCECEDQRLCVIVFEAVTEHEAQHRGVGGPDRRRERNEESKPSFGLPGNARRESHDRAATRNESGRYEKGSAAFFELGFGPVQAFASLFGAVGTSLDKAPESGPDCVRDVVATKRARGAHQDNGRQEELLLAGGDATEDDRGFARHDGKHRVEERHGKNYRIEPWAR